MTTLQALAGASKIPGPRDKVYKDECFFSFDSPVRYVDKNCHKLKM